MGKGGMDRFDRIYALDGMLRNARHPVSRRTLEDGLECSRATVRRTIEDMRDFLGAPIRYDPVRNGYYYDRTAGGGTYELPGLWLNPSELYALLAAQELFRQVQPGLLDSHLKPLRERIRTILAAEGLEGPDLERWVRIRPYAARPPDWDVFRRAAEAVLRRKRLLIDYHGRARDTATRREVSPQRLIHYRDNWYLDAWCHERRALRRFALDRIRAAEPRPEAAEEIARADLDAALEAAYGIFADEPAGVAVLRFTPERARWVADETWHPEQEGQWLADGRYELRLPYGDSRELVLDILKFGADVEVAAPEALRAEVAQRLREAADQYVGAGKQEREGAAE